MTLRIHHAPLRFLLGLFLATLPAACAWADCIDEAARYQRVHPHVLRAIAYHESRMRPETVHHNTNDSTDIGLMGINTVHTAELARYGITSRMLSNPCVNAYIGAWLLRRKVQKYGSTWAAVAAYHSETPTIGARYAQRIQQVLRDWARRPPAARAGAPR